MKKTYLLVDGQNRAIVERQQIGKRGQVYLDERPEKRIKVIVGYFGIDCTMVGFALVCLGLLRATWQPDPITIALSCMLLPCGCFGVLVDKFAEEKPIQNNRHFGSWRDPYGLAQGNVNSDSTKKLYYIVDAERSAVVDVIRLGKWGQKRLERRAKRQAERESK